jgi:2-(1,2-epoxy-1,2-dihydrophenyl)acetyl-CoA isomerase
MDTLAVERDGAVLWVRLHRPEARNGIDAVMRDELESTLRAADIDRSVRAIVVTGSGRDFCTGADLRAAGGAEAPLDVLDYRRALVPYQELFRTLWELETPVVSAVNGTVAGVGWLLALLADLVVAAEGARWTHAFTRRGMAPHAGDPYFLPRILPFHVLNELALLSDTVTTADLARWGAVNRMVAADAVEPTARELADRIAAGPTLSYGQAKRLYRRSLESDLTTALAEERSATALLSPTRDRAEGLAALGERRPAHFTGS